MGWKSDINKNYYKVLKITFELYPVKDVCVCVCVLYLGRGVWEVPEINSDWLHDVKARDGAGILLTDYLGGMVNILHHYFRFNTLCPRLYLFFIILHSASCGLIDSAFPQSTIEDR